MERQRSARRCKGARDRNVVGAASGFGSRFGAGGGGDECDSRVGDCECGGEGRELRGEGVEDGVQGVGYRDGKDGGACKRRAKLGLDVACEVWGSWRWHQGNRKGEFREGIQGTDEGVPELGSLA